MNVWLERNRTLILSLIGLAVLAAVAAVALRWQRPTPITIEPPPPTRTPGPVTVYVSGAVRQPDVYTLPPGSRVTDALNAAGGPLNNANLEAVNLASPLAEGQQIHIPLVGEVTVEGEEGEPALTVVYPLNLNTATLAELETLPGIGPSLAQAIVDHRDAFGPFTDPAQIQNVSGIGPATYEEFKDLITAP